MALTVSNRPLTGMLRAPSSPMRLTSPIRLSFSFHETPKEFALFSLLPPELRQHIWSLAAPDPEQPAVHVLGTRLCRETPIGRSQYVDYSAGGNPNIHLFTLGVPGMKVTKTTSPKKDGFSAYLNDSALWFTCRESREVMMRQLREGDYVTFTLPEAFNWGSSQTYTINRSSDLMIMRPFDLRHERPPLDQNAWCGSYFHNLPALRPTPGRGGIKLAVEYDPDEFACSISKWNFFAESLLDAVHEVARVEGEGILYVIDKTIKLRDPNTDLDAAGRMPAYECNGARYYDVRAVHDEHFYVCPANLEVLVSIRNDWDALTAKNLFTRPEISKGQLQATTRLLACVGDGPQTGALSGGFATGEESGSCAIM